MKGYYKLRSKVLDILNTKLSSKLHYHGVHHTLNALKISSFYLKNENIAREEAKLIRLGILFHDIGFTISNIDHESKSVVIAKELMTVFNFSKEHIKIIKGLILATKIPQRPKNLLEKIICDVDLDYLGRLDYYKISDQLFRELKEFSIVTTIKEWNQIQIKFLEAHRYHTDYGINILQPEKENRIIELKSLLLS